MTPFRPRRAAAARLLLALYWAALTTSLLWPLPQGEGETGGPPVDRSLHLVAFLILELLLFAQWPQPAGRPRGWLALAAGTLAVVGYGGVVEALQGLVGRSPSPVDAAFNVVGAGLGALGVAWMRRKSLFAGSPRGKGAEIPLTAEVEADRIRPLP